MKVKHSQSFDVLVLKSLSVKKKKTHHQKKCPCAAIKTAPQVQTSNLTCSIDSPDNALKETLFALNNIKMPTAIYNPIHHLLQPVLLASSAAPTTGMLLLFVAK